MSFIAKNIQVGGVTQKTEDSSSTSKTTQVELSDKELEFLLITIKNGLFKGEYVELLYNLTLKLQNHFVDLTTKK